MSVSTEAVRAASAVDKAMTMKFAPTTAVAANKSVAVPSKAKKSVDIYEMSDSDDSSIYNVMSDSDRSDHGSASDFSDSQNYKI